MALGRLGQLGYSSVSIHEIVGEKVTNLPPPSLTQIPEPTPTWPPNDATVVCYNLSKSFGQLVALSNFSVAIRPGVTGLLGPNGAGKSTLIRVIAGLAKPQIGNVWVAGGDPRANADVRRRVSIVPQQEGVFERLTALQFVELGASLNKTPNPREAALWALNLVALSDVKDKYVGEFSKGMKQRAKIAFAICSDPAVVILDEPLNGLDPKQRRNMIELFHNLGSMGKTVIVSSHVLEEVQRFGSHIVVMARGRLAAEGDFRSIRAKMDDQPRTIRVTCSSSKSLGSALIDLSLCEGLTVVNENQLVVKSSHPNLFRQQIASTARDKQIRLTEINPLDDDLESVFKYLVERAP